MIILSDFKTHGEATLIKKMCDLLSGQVDRSDDQHMMSSSFSGEQSFQKPLPQRLGPLETHYSMKAMKTTERIINTYFFRIL